MKKNYNNTIAEHAAKGLQLY